MKKTLLLCFLFLFSSGLLLAQSDTPFWRQLNNFEPLSSNYYGAIDAFGENLVYVIHDEGYFYKSEDAGESWVSSQTNVAVTYFDLQFVDNQTGYAVGESGTIVKTTDQGETWTSITTGTTEDLFSVDVSDDGKIWVVGGNGALLNSDDQGTTWGLDNSLSSEIFTDIQFRNNQEGYITGTNGTLYYTEDGGVSWTSIDFETVDCFYGLSVTENYVRFLAGYEEVDAGFPLIYENVSYYEGNDNETWNAQYIEYSDGKNDLYFQDDEMGFYTAGACTLGSNGCEFHIPKTTDGGESWSDDYLYHAPDVYNGPGTSSTIEFGSEDVGYALIGSAILKTTNGGVFSTEDFLKSTTVSIYPNPVSQDFFNLELKNTDPAQLRAQIFDINGRLIKEFGNLQQKNKVDVSTLSKGIYFVNIKMAGKVVNTKKLIRN